METGLAAGAALATAAAFAWHRELRRLAARLVASFAQPTRYSVTSNTADSGPTVTGRARGATSRGSG